MTEMLREAGALGVLLLMLAIMVGINYMENR